MDDRLYENMRIWKPSASSCEGIYDTPKISPTSAPIVSLWLPIGQLRGRDLKGTDGVQTYVYDYKLNPLWERPTAYLPLLKKARCVLSPDFSLYTDVPRALNIYNHYRKHWLGALWQLNGITVIPAICWSDKESFGYCFDGEPMGATVSISSVGTQRRAEDRRGFLYGYAAMLERLKPSGILFFGIVPKECRGNILPCEAYYKQIERRASCYTKTKEV